MPRPVHLLYALVAVVLARFYLSEAALPQEPVVAVRPASVDSPEMPEMGSSPVLLGDRAVPAGAQGTHLVTASFGPAWENLQGV
jgi:hypothetical protein